MMSTFDVKLEVERNKNMFQLNRRKVLNLERKNIADTQRGLFNAYLAMINFYNLFEGQEVIKLLFQPILNREVRSKMFGIVTETWNPVTGCTHGCVYCWARWLAKTKLKNMERYKEGFKPRLNESEFKKRFSGGVVFVSDMGDLFCEAVPDEWIRRIIEHIRRFRNTCFLFLTKNPVRYMDFVTELPPNVILGATIETDKDELVERVSRAPPPSSRVKAMTRLNWPMKLVSIEPILDFNLDRFTERIRGIGALLIYVGYDNYNHRLPEPPLEKTLKLVEKLSQFTLVETKTLRPAWYEVKSPQERTLLAIKRKRPYSTPEHI